MLQHLMFLFIFLTYRAAASAVVVEVITGEHEDDCGIYPPCKQYGDGCHEILEDCRRYINCTLGPDGHYTQVPSHSDWSTYDQITGLSS